MANICLVYYNRSMREHIKTAHGLGKRAVKSKSFKRYLIIGFSTVAIDFLILFILRNILSIRLVFAVTIAYWTSIAYNFSLNRYWSFEASSGMVPKQMFLYGCLLLFNYSITLGIVWSLESMGFSEYIAKMFALGLTITWTYVLYKKIVFNTEL